MYSYPYYISICNYPENIPIVLWHALCSGFFRIYKASVVSVKTLKFDAYFKSLPWVQFGQHPALDWLDRHSGQFMNISARISLQIVFSLLFL